MSTTRQTARLLQDGVRVLTHTMRRASTALGDRPGRVRNRLRSVGRRVLLIGRQARAPETRDALVRSYRQLMATTRAVARDATTMVRRISQRLRTAPHWSATIFEPRTPATSADATAGDAPPDQTRARLLGDRVARAHGNQRNETTGQRVGRRMAK